jgi:hypothetical protein
LKTHATPEELTAVVGTSSYLQRTWIGKRAFSATTSSNIMAVWPCEGVRRWSQVPVVSWASLRI